MSINIPLDILLLFLTFYIVSLLVLNFGYLHRRFKVSDAINLLAISVVFVGVYYIVSLILSAGIRIGSLDPAIIAYVIALWFSIQLANYFWSEDIAGVNRRTNMMFLAVIITIIIYLSLIHI